MAKKSKTPKTPKVKKFEKSGFYKTAEIPALQEQLAKYNVSDDQLRTEATAAYQPAYEMQKTAYENQLAELSMSRDRDVRKLNNQFDRSLNSIMTGLNKRNMGRSSLVSTRGVENENARNGAIAETSYNYLTKQNEINANVQQSQAEYAQNVENKQQELKREYQSQYIALQSQIASLQSGAYNAYATYLLNKKKV